MLARASRRGLKAGESVLAGTSRDGGSLSAQEGRTGIGVGGQKKQKS